jgi:hypothetical protein
MDQQRCSPTVPRRRTVTGLAVYLSEPAQINIRNMQCLPRSAQQRYSDGYRGDVGAECHCALFGKVLCAFRGRMATHNIMPDVRHVGFWLPPFVHLQLSRPAAECHRPIRPITNHRPPARSFHQCYGTRQLVATAEESHHPSIPGLAISSMHAGALNRTKDSGLTACIIYSDAPRFSTRSDVRSHLLAGVLRDLPLHYNVPDHT